MCRQAGHLPRLNADEANMFSTRTSESIIQDHVRKYKTKAAELKDIVQEVLHHPDFDVREVDTNMHERSGLKVLRELLADARLAGRQHFAFKEYNNARGVSYHCM
jgi:CheY-like chemotaxis protein